MEGKKRKKEWMKEGNETWKEGRKKVAWKYEGVNSKVGGESKEWMKDGRIEGRN